MSDGRSTLHFDHEGEFEILAEDRALSVDMSLVERIIFTDHENMIRYTFSKIRTETADDVHRAGPAGLQGN